MENKTILMIAYYFPPASGIGTFRITKFSKYLKKFGYNPIIVTLEAKNYITTDMSLMEDLKGIKRYDIKLLNKNKNKVKDFYYSLLEQIEPILKKENPSYAFITGGPFYYLQIGPILKKQYNINYIIDLRDPWSLQKTIDGNLIKKAKNIVYKKYAHFIEYKIFKRASFITTVNNTMTNDYKKSFPKYQHKICTIPNAIDLEDYINEKVFQFENQTILYTGKFSTSSGFRNPTNFLIALKKINSTRKKKIKFIHIGEKEKEIEQIVKEQGCQDFVEFYGNKPYKETISYCKGADILLVLSTGEKSEQTGKIYDYLGCDKKILAITNKENEIYKICQKYDIKVANPQSIKEIEDSIIEISKMKTSKYNKKNMETREKATKKLINLIENM